MVDEEILDLMKNKKYYRARELMYSKTLGLYIEPYKYKKFLDYMDEKSLDDEDFISLDLLSFNGYNLRITKCQDLILKTNEYLKLVMDDVNSTGSFLSFRNANSIVTSRVFSEIEGTLNIESVPTTRSLLNEIIKDNKKVENNNEQIILNMSRAIEYVNSVPDFNENNLYKLYCLLSDKCLDKEDALINDSIYRHDEVEIDNYNGCPHERIKECMDSLFSLINKNLNNSEISIYLPHIAHYYIVYIHPYFDYNGRTARMVSYWIHLLQNKNNLPPIISEAINQTKNEYYLSLRESRDSHNDLTYFLLYLYEVSIKYFLTYKNIEFIESRLKNESIIISETDRNYIKRILISNNGKFTYEDFIKWSNVKMSKQGAFKILNKLEEYKFLLSEINKSNKKLFRINDDLIEYIY